MAVEIWHFPHEAETKYGFDAWRIRDSPHLQARTLCEIRPGTQFQVTGRLDNSSWLRVRLRVGSVEREGWIYPFLPRGSLGPGQTVDLQLLFPVAQSGSLSARRSSEVPSPPKLERTRSSQEELQYYLRELKDRRAAVAAAARDPSTHPEQRVQLELRVQDTMDRLEVLGVDPDKLLELDGADSLENPEDVASMLMSQLERTKSYMHADFENPRAESCWLSTLFQSLWHSRVFHAAFEGLIKPLPRAGKNTALGALQETWELYEQAASGHRLVPVSALVKAWGRGYGDAAEALGKLQAAEDLKPLADISALVPVPWSGRAPTLEQLNEMVENMGASEQPLVALDFIFPALSPASMQTLALALAPRSEEGAMDLGQDLRLVAMICYMEDFRHWVVFCRMLSEPSHWMWFNDLPGTSEGARRRLDNWGSVARACARFGACPKMLLYENPKAAQIFFEKHKDAAMDEVPKDATGGSHVSGRRPNTGGCRQM